MAKRRYNSPRVTVYNIHPNTILASSNTEYYDISFNVEIEHNIDWSKSSYNVWEDNIKY